MHKGLYGEYYRGDYAMDRRTGIFKNIGICRGRNMTRKTENLQNQMSKNMKNAWKLGSYGLQKRRCNAMNAFGVVLLGIRD